MDTFPALTHQNKFSDHIQDVLTDPDEVRNLERDRAAYWDGDSGTVVIHNPNDPDDGTAFVLDTGKDYFDTDLE